MTLNSSWQRDQLTAAWKYGVERQKTPDYYPPAEPRNVPKSSWQNIAVLRKISHSRTIFIATGPEAELAAAYETDRRRRESARGRRPSVLPGYRTRLP